MAKSSTKMSADHKAALAKGRAQAKAVRDYLQMLERDGRRSSNLSPDQLEEKIHQVEARIQDENDPATRLELVQKRLDYQEQLNASDDTPDPEQVEKAFIDAAKEYSERKGISYPAWREIGVPAAALREAGIPRTRKAS